MEIKERNSRGKQRESKDGVRNYDNLNYLLSRDYKSFEDSARDFKPFDQSRQFGGNRPFENPQHFHTAAGGQFQQVYPPGKHFYLFLGSSRSIWRLMTSNLKLRRWSKFVNFKHIKIYISLFLYKLLITKITKLFFHCRILLLLKLDFAFVFKDVLPKQNFKACLEFVFLEPLWIRPNEHIRPTF